MIITSTGNKTVKWLESLQNKKYRREHKAFLAEGERLIKDGLEYSKPLVVAVSESYQNEYPEDAWENQIVLSDAVFKKISQTVNPQGLLAAFPMPEKVFQKEEHKNLLLLNKVMDPGNLGAMIRTAEAAGFSGIVLDKGCADVFNPKVVRSTMSSIFRLGLYEVENLAEFIGKIQPDFELYAAALHKDSISLFETCFSSKTAIIIGNEANGIEEDVINSADHIISIPMQGKIESLNAAVSASVIMYECLRQKNI